MPLELFGKDVVVVGLGISGLWITRFLLKQGAHVTVSENSPSTSLDPEKAKEVQDLGARLECGGHGRETFLKAHMIVISPGVPHDMPLLDDARKKGVRVLGELELASRLIRKPVIAVTGTNGKTTVTTLLGKLMENAGYNVFVGGNIGTPLTACILSENDIDLAVVEVSSFQLDTIETFSPLVSVILNITPDHLDRYDGYEAYVRSKLRIFENQKCGQFVVLNDDDERLASVTPESGVSVLRYGRDRKAGRHAYMKGDAVILETPEAGAAVIDLKAFRLPGIHNRENLMAVSLVAQAMNIDPGVIGETLRNFRGLPHRIEHVRDVRGVSFYDDSKATNVDAAARAVAGFKRPVILIAGGRHKGADYKPLVEAGRDIIKKAFFLGEAKSLLSAAFGDVIPHENVGDMDEAVKNAFDSAASGDVVLLSPACSSFDMYADYTHRGRVFCTAVQTLEH